MSTDVRQPYAPGPSSSSAVNAGSIAAATASSRAYIADPVKHPSATLAQARVRKKAAAPIISSMSCTTCQRRPSRLCKHDAHLESGKGSWVSPRHRFRRGRSGVSSYDDQYPSSIEHAHYRHPSTSSNLRKALVLSYGPERGQAISSSCTELSGIRLRQRVILPQRSDLKACPGSTRGGMDLQSATGAPALIAIKMYPFDAPLPLRGRRRSVASSLRRRLSLLKPWPSAAAHHHGGSLSQLGGSLSQLGGSEEGYHRGESTYVDSSLSEGEAHGDSSGSMTEQGPERIACSGSEASARGGRGRSGNGPRDSSNTSLGSAGETFEGRRYYLRVVQQPTTGCAFGRDHLSRLAVQPPLIVQLRVTNTDDEDVDFDDELPFLICRLSLTTEDGGPADLMSGTPSPTPLGPRHSTGMLLERTATLARQQRTASASELHRTTASSSGSGSGSGTPLSSPSSTALSMLYGTLVASPVQLPNQRQRQRTFFVFPEVSIRGRGKFRINAAVMRMPLPTSEQVSSSTDVAAVPPIRGAMLAAVSTEPFNVVAIAEYVAPHITELTRHFAANGVGLLLPPNQTSNE